MAISNATIEANAGKFIKVNAGGTDVEFSAGAGGGTFVGRGDPASEAYDKGSWTTNGTYIDWDLSAIVPAGAKAVLLGVSIKDDATNSVFKVRKNGSASDYTCSFMRTQAANLNTDNNLIVECDTNRVIEYNAANLAWISINAIVLGWWT